MASEQPATSPCTGGGVNVAGALLSQQDAGARLRRILEDAGRLKGHHCTTREVESLRVAYQRVVSSIRAGQLQNLVTQCDNVLWQLETQAKGDHNAHTGDEDRELKGADTYQIRNIPRRRRMQTFVVSCLCFFTAVPFCLVVFTLMLLHSTTFPIAIVYLIYMWWSRPMHPVKRKSWLFKHPMWEHLRDYFPVRLVVPRAARRLIVPPKNYIFCYHPHGVHSFGVLGSFVSDANDVDRWLPGITIHPQTLGINFWIPFWRELGLGLGLGDASAACIRKTLASGPGESVLIVVGGAEESLLSSPNTNDLLLTKRKGFVKIALQTGSPLVPIFGFGETNCYGNWADGRPWLQRILKMSQKKLGFAIPAVKGRGWFTYSGGFLPHRRQIITVVGEPLAVPKIANPTPKDIDEWHHRYVECLLRLYRENKDVYDLQSRKDASIVS